ncbi:SMI1/KNR4 family protein [Bacillus sp. NPDC094077]|uniref:SMI1/KNR4 family protein n=1 Tax=Bacillus sp. NPDC094077 TaxID=3390932 RepID=UPI003D064F37
MNHEQWISLLKAVLNQIQRLGGEIDSLIIKDPISVTEINKVENQLGISIPLSYKKVMLKCFSHLEWGWYFPDDFPLDDKFQDIFGSRGVLALSELVECENMRQELVQDVFNDPADSYDQIWHNKLAFFNVGNGDLFAFDLNKDEVDPPIVYLSHDDGEMHGFILGNNFIDFMNKWSKIGFVGGESWSLLPFVDSQNSGINLEGENVKEWKVVLNL